MPNTIAPAPAATISGAPLPLVALPQGELLTVNQHDVPLLKDGLSEGVSFRTLRLDQERLEWVVVATFAPGKGVPLHYHSGPAEVLTLQGRWLYKEHPDQPQTAGSYLYEPGGSVHTLYAPADNAEDTIIFVRVQGTNINFDDDGAFHSLLDALSLRHLTDMVCAERGLTARYIEGGECGYTAEV
jgi:2,4'-dihydroxyacetophenone dioxygenase